jgi:NAD(P)-dependent dehydrogenase (short-subunit alcohol dehydrogenase family)
MRDKVVVITGAFGALGRAVAEVAKAQGARVVSIDYAPAPDASDPLAFGGIDLSRYEAAERVINEARGKAGAIDALLNIAGGFAFAKLADSDDALWDRMNAINLKTTVHACKAALPHLIESNGAIVNVGAFGALKAGPGMGAYAASKEGVHKLTQSLAEEMKGKVRVNAVLPSTIDTAANRKDMPKADFSAWVAPADLAQVMLFLASDDAHAITGALLPVTGKV